jgi:osmotically-inducible protein OsmY
MRAAETSDIVKVFAHGLALGVALLAMGAAAGADDAATERSVSQQVKDAWIHGRLETAYALNRYLNPFDIDTEVSDGVVRLTGTLNSDIDRDLAIKIAEGIDGVREVESALAVNPGARPTTPVQGNGEERTFGQWIDDVTATARVKSNLVANGNTKGLSIDVDTENDVVTLKGTVSSRKEKMLAEMIARNTEGIANVRNQLEINEQM